MENTICFLLFHYETALSLPCSDETMQPPLLTVTGNRYAMTIILYYYNSRYWSFCRCVFCWSDHDSSYNGHHLHCDEE